MNRAMNFSAGPAALPEVVLQQAQSELLNYQDCGTSIMEQSHRGPLYSAVHDEAIALLTELLDIPPSHQVIFLQGGASQQFATLPMNFLPRGRTASYLVTGAWGQKAYDEAVGVAQRAGGVITLANVNAEIGAFTSTQAGGVIDPDSAYFHCTSNETIHGVQFGLPGSPWPTTEVPIFCDMSSDFLWQPLDLSRFDFIYAGSQKNIGPAGVVVCIARKSLIESGSTELAKILQYRSHADKNSMLNTPPTFSIYMVRNVLAWIKELGGLRAMQALNLRKAARLYEVIDGDEFFSCPVDMACRSVMNVVFRLPDEELEQRFLAEAARRGMSGLKGHRSVGGLRASIYNAAPYDWVEALASLMQEFAAEA